MSSPTMPGPKPAVSNPPTATSAILAIVFAVLFWPLGLVFGIVAIIRIGDAKGALGGRGLAIAALAVSASMMFVSGILVAIAIPNFVRYQLRSKQSEARIGLTSIATAQESRRAMFDRYLPSAPNPSSPPSAEATSWETRPCPEECATKDSSLCQGLSCLGYTPPTPVRYRYACEAIAPALGVPAAFTCAAVGDLDGDGKLSAMVIGSANGTDATTLQAPIPAIAAALCTGPIPAGRVFDCQPSTF